MFRLKPHFLVDHRLLAVRYVGILHQLILVAEVEILLCESDVHVSEEPFDLIGRMVIVTHLLGFVSGLEVSANKGIFVWRRILGVVLHHGDRIPSRVTLDVNIHGFSQSILFGGRQVLKMVLLLILEDILQLYSMLFTIICLLKSKSFFHIVISYTKSNWESLIAWSDSVLAITPETLRIERLNISPIYSTHICDSKPTTIARNIGIAARTIFLINNPLGSFRRMKGRLLKRICATMTVISRMANKRYTSKIINVSLIWVVRAHI